MGQKVNPHGLRVGVIKDWDSRWFAKKADFGDTLVEDYNLRKTLKKQLYLAGVPKIEIERDASKVRIHIHCAKPGMVIGKGGAEIEKLRAQCEKQLGKPVVIEPNIAATALSAKSVLFGDMSAYFVRLAGGVRFERSDEFAFQNDLVTFRAILRGDGILGDQTGAVKHFVGNAA